MRRKSAQSSFSSDLLQGCVSRLPEMAKTTRILGIPSRCTLHYVPALFLEGRSPPGLNYLSLSHAYKTAKADQERKHGTDCVSSCAAAVLLGPHVAGSMPASRLCAPTENGRGAACKSRSCPQSPTCTVPDGFIVLPPLAWQNLLKAPKARCECLTRQAPSCLSPVRWGLK